MDECARAPLTRCLLSGQGAATFKGAICGFVVNGCYSRVQTPIRRNITRMDSAVVRRSFLLLFFAFYFPLINDGTRFLAADGIRAFYSMSSRDLSGLFSETYLLFVIAVVTVRRFRGHPLYPVVVFQVTHACFTIPIGERPCFVRLLPVTISVLCNYGDEILPYLSDVLFNERTMYIVSREVRCVRALRTFMTNMGIQDGVSRQVSCV